ncbi:MAG TPA: DUF255 domain-containing protein [Candidatus Binatia bacterium]|nr:DUF255 domain-containing protein [Candidatus Binatia bacterium]
MIRFSPNPNRANLIHWHEWGDDAFRQAQEQDKPLMLFLTAFWCRFCQRMDEGAFSDEENIALLNAYFIAIRAEDTQRPDVNTRYNLNGWPTIAFMAPQGELLGATNYLPSEEFGNLLARLYTGYQEKKDEIRSARNNPGETPSETEAGVTREHPSESTLSEVTRVIMELVDPVHGGYGRGQKFIHPEANDFLLSRYEATKEASYLGHVRLTLDGMRAGQIHDHEGGGYFRTCSNADWSRPHREKLLGEQAGLLANCLRTFRITQHSDYALMAEDIIDYLNRRLSHPTNGAFYGCEDFLRIESAEASSSEEFFSIIDACVYTDAGAQAIVAYLDAAEILGKFAYKERALRALDFLWNQCRNPEGGMFHYFEGAPRVSGLLNDQARMGTALVQAHKATNEIKYLEQAKQVAEFILARLKNPAGGYYDIAAPGPAYLSFRLTLIEQNGAAASFFLALAETTREPRYRDAALWALSAFSTDFGSYGIHAAGFGQALGEFMKHH